MTTLRRYRDVLLCWACLVLTFLAYGWALSRGRALDGIWRSLGW